MPEKKTDEELKQRVEELEKEFPERNRAGKALKSAERRYRELSDETPVMYVITRNHKGTPTIEDCNDLFLRSLVYPRNQVLNRALQISTHRNQEISYRREAIKRRLKVV